MHILKKYTLIAVLLFIANFLHTQTPSVPEPTYNPGSEWFTDFLLGPYLFVEHIPYRSVMMYGTRLGKRNNYKWGYVLEYVVGQQEDDQNTTGLTHHVSLHALYYLNQPQSKFRPYAYLGGGFLEFKSFTRDEYNMAYYGGVGVEISMRSQLHSFIEPRYLNIAPFSFEAQNEIGVFCGVRILY